MPAPPTIAATNEGARNATIQAIMAEYASQNPGGNTGVWLLALLVCVYYLGILSSQTFTYFQWFPRDSRYYKSLVLIVLALSFAQFLIIFLVSWQWFVTHFGDWNEVVLLPPMVAVEPIVAQVTVFFAQLFFAHRCLILTDRNWVIFGGVLCMMLCSVAMFTMVGVQLITDPYNVQADENFTIPALVLNFTTDAIITIVSTWQLLASRKGFNPNTDTVLNRLLAVTWEAAAPPAVIALVNIAVFITMGKKNILYTFFNILMPRLYVFSLMFTLNSRTYIRETFESSDMEADQSQGSAAFKLSDLVPRPHRNRPVSNTATRTSATVVFASMPGTLVTGTMGVIDERVNDVNVVLDDHDFGSSETDLQIDLDKLVMEDTGSDKEDDLGELVKRSLDRKLSEQGLG